MRRRTGVKRNNGGITHEVHEHEKKILDNEFTITDMNSSNGTKLNGERIVPGRPYLLKDGDIIRIAGADFQVRIQ